MGRPLLTADIKDLVTEALDSLPRPLTEDVTDDVFFAIETTPQWRARYDSLTQKHGQTTLNSWGGYWIANAVDRTGTSGQTPAQKSKLILSYSKLDQPAAPQKGKKATEAAARESVFAFYMANKSSYVDAVSVKEEIVQLVMAGMPVAEAFGKAMELSGKPAGTV